MSARLISLATAADVPAIKQLADRHRREIGFVPRGALEASGRRGGLWLAHPPDEAEPRQVLGYVQVHHRLDGQITLHTIAVDAPHRGAGIGRALVRAVEEDCRGRDMRGILLRCPVDLPANAFYARLGFELLRTEPGKRRPLHLWWKSCPAPH
jgi:ribosomal protein S18 acetylase RimI-like enzyme